MLGLAGIGYFYFHLDRRLGSHKISAHHHPTFPFL